MPFDGDHLQEVIHVLFAEALEPREFTYFVYEHMLFWISLGNLPNLGLTLWNTKY